MKQYFKIEASTKNGIGQLRITDYIGSSSHANSESVRMLVDGFLEAGVTRSDVYINSGGGSVFQAAEIINELKRLDRVTITVGALAASATTRILAAFPGGRAYRNSQFMIHKPSIDTKGNEDQLQSDLKAIQNLTSDYRQAYANISGKSEEEIEEIWGKGDYWMNAEEAKAFGLIAEIIKEDSAIQARDIAVMTACGCPHIPASTAPKIKNDNQMDRKQIIARLGLDADATDEQIMGALATAKQKADDVDNQKAQAEANAKIRAEALADRAIADKKFTAKERDTYVTLAIANYDAAKTAIDALPSLPKLSAEINPHTSGADLAARVGWTLDDYLDKDPEAYAAMLTENPEKAKKLEDEYFKSQH
ncbi:ATP-dependent Clp protease proteolytic subunit [Sinomicrobium kalidii]|uniref:ATP-dependent Clp protease proteolytic subunit n=1 Tax=Sinomicrobium kalidii TaxID=2900738 RepID=UPI001E364B25|nr:ATP-dependent Clp protease proteolytic subunit [Sinomicrobium kalidii]UGU15208.1 ATP-dependent Clp protease proteolytic subunit [Sinomicrobium kalidii]